VLLGKTLSDMHAALADLDSVQLSVEDELEALVGRIKRYVTDTTKLDAIRVKLGLTLNIHFLHIKKILDVMRQLPGKRSLHMDFVRSNILFATAQPTDKCVFDTLAISGILDFEKTAYGHPLFDVARTLAFLLVDCKYKSEADVTKYFIDSGYQKRGASTLAQTGRLLDQLVCLFLIHDFYKFLRHNPYESLAQNEHYIRTRDILYNRGVIHYI
jgi:Ser/Thr protein kinase RdoA (MazF antagonist)